MSPYEWVVAGFLVGNLYAYLMLHRPVIKLKNEYIRRLETRVQRRS